MLTGSTDFLFPYVAFSKLLNYVNCLTIKEYCMSWQARALPWPFFYSIADLIRSLSVQPAVG